MGWQGLNPGCLLTCQVSSFPAVLSLKPFQSCFLSSSGFSTFWGIWFLSNHIPRFRDTEPNCVGFGLGKSIEPTQASVAQVVKLGCLGQYVAEEGAGVQQISRRVPTS